MPRYEVTQFDRQFQPLQIIFYLIGVIYFVLAILNLTSNPTTWSIVNFMIAFSVLIYVLGRFIGDLLVSRDFVELGSDKITFRSTPPFGEGWLPRTREFLYTDIRQVHILEVEPLYAPSQKRLSLLLIPQSNKRYFFGNNLTEEQIIKIGLHLKGTVRLSSTLANLLGTSREEVEDQLQDLIKMGKSIWNSFKNRDKGEN